MASGRHYGEVVRQVGRLLAGGGGTAAALGEGQLLRRFAADRDEAAFEALMTRHGPMVLGTCRRMLVDPRDVEDAFQATFLVLARRAGSIRDADRLGPWLHGVARRVAGRARALAARRGAVEKPGGEDRAVVPADAFEGAELRAAIDEELSRLPEKYRAPLVLCYLEGLTHDEAALQLRWPVGTVRSRLAGGRDRLRTRLTRRGLAPSAAALPALPPVAAIPEALLSTTARLATGFGTTPAHVAALAKGALIAMTASKLKAIAAVGLMAGLTAGGVGALAQQSGDGKGTAPAAAREATGQVPGEMQSVGKQLRELEEEASKIQSRRDSLEARRRDLTAKADPRLEDPRKALEAANDRIKSLEAELKAAKAEPAREKTKAASGVTPSRVFFGSGMSMNMSGMGGVSVAAGGDGLGRRSGEDSRKKQPLVLNLPDSVNVLFSPADQDRVTIINPVSGERKTYQPPKGITKVIPVIGPRAGAVAFYGPEITQIAAFDGQEGVWYPQALEEPAKDSVAPVVATQGVSYVVGRYLYLFSAQAKKWGILKLKEAPEADSPLRGERGFANGLANGKWIIAEGDIVHIYSAQTGEWTHFDTKEKEGK